MKKSTLIPFILLLFFSASAQDKIISINHDTIHCQILSISNDRILYELKNNDGSLSGMFIPLSEVAEYYRSKQPENKSKRDKLKTPNPRYIPEKRACLSLYAGLSKMPWYLDYFEPSSAIPDFYNKLKTGYHVNARAHFMIKSFFGLGAEYSFFKTRTSGDLQRDYSLSTFFTISENYRFYIHYLGPSVLFRQHLDAQRKLILSESISAGVLFIHMQNQNTYPTVNQSGYNDNATNTLLTGNSFSSKAGISAEYKLTEHVSIGLGGDFIWCSLKKASIESKGSNNYSYSVDDEKLSKAMKLSRFDYSVVLRFYF